MRVRATVAPNGQPVEIDPRAHRRPGETTWYLPEWGHPLSLAVYPLFATQARYLIPIASAFCISNVGIFTSALHNILDGFRHHPSADRLRLRKQFRKNNTLRNVGFSVFHHYRTPTGEFVGNIWGVESLNAAPPTDVVFGFPQFVGRFPYLPLPISFAVPRVDTRVICLGYTDFSSPHAGISVDDLESGTASWDSVYAHRFCAKEARVQHIFTQRFARSFVEGPCFTIDTDVGHGLSGGPVVSENGHVCGIISAGATSFFGRPTTIVSLLYPTLLTAISFGVNMGSIRINAKHPLVDLVAQGAVLTDGSEELVSVRPEEGQFALGPMIRSEDAASVFDDFAGFQSNRQASRHSRETYRFRRRRQDDDLSAQ